MRLSFDSPFVSYPAQALFAGGAVSIACLLYQRTAKAFESDKVSDNDISHVLKGLTVVVLSAFAGKSAHFLGASVYKSGSLAAIVCISLTIFEQFREKGGSSPSSSPPTTPTSKQEPTASPSPQPAPTTPLSARQSPPPSTAATKPVNPKSPTQVPRVSVKSLAKKLESARSNSFTPPKPAPTISITIETVETTVEHPEETPLSTRDDDDVNYGDPPPPPAFERANEPTVVHSSENSALVQTLQGLNFGDEDGEEEVSECTETESVATWDQIPPPVESVQNPTHLALIDSLKGLPLGDGEEEACESTAEWSEVDSSVTVESSTPMTLVPPTPFEKICAEVLKTENIFVTNLRLYQSKLEKIQEKSHPQENAFKSLVELIQVSEAFLKTGIPQAYLNFALMTRYINALEEMTKNLLKEFHDDAILPVQRGPRHKLFLEQLVEIDQQYNDALTHVKRLFSAINTAPKIAQLKALLEVLKALNAKENQNKRMKIRLIDSTTSLTGSTYQLDERKKKLMKKSKTKSLDNTTLVTNDSTLSLHGILDFLLSLPSDNSEVLINRPLCIPYLEKSTWWKDVSKKDNKGDFEGKTLSHKLEALKALQKK